MNNIIFILLGLFLLSSCQTSGRVPIYSTSHGADYQDDDWNEIFYTNCVNPADTIVWETESDNKFLRFKLKGLQKGGCSTDKRPRHGALFWERVEIKQRSGFDKNLKYNIEFYTRFIEGFKGLKENFFQIHQSVIGCRNGPIVMLKFNNGIFQGDFGGITEKKFNVEENLNKWIKFNVILNFEEGIYSVKVNDNNFIDERPFRKKLKACGVPHIKFGIYRPGYKQPNETSIVDFDKFQTKEIK